MTFADFRWLLANDGVIAFYATAVVVMAFVILYQIGELAWRRVKLWRCRRYCPRQQREYRASQERSKAASW